MHKPPLFNNFRTVIDATFDQTFQGLRSNARVNKRTFLCAEEMGEPLLTKEARVIPLKMTHFKAMRGLIVLGALTNQTAPRQQTS